MSHNQICTYHQLIEYKFKSYSCRVVYFNKDIHINVHDLFKNIDFTESQTQKIIDLFKNSSLYKNNLENLLQKYSIEYVKPLYTEIYLHEIYVKETDILNILKTWSHPFNKDVYDFFQRIFNKNNINNLPNHIYVIKNEYENKQDINRLLLENKQSENRLILENKQKYHIIKEQTQQIQSLTNEINQLKKKNNETMLVNSYLESSNQSLQYQYDRFKKHTSYEDTNSKKYFKKTAYFMDKYNKDKYDNYKY